MISDDCVYRFYVCTERNERLPANNIDCNHHFENCFDTIKSNSKIVASRFEASGNIFNARTICHSEPKDEYQLIM